MGKNPGMTAGGTQPTIEQVIYSIKNMPDLLMEHDHGIILSSSEDDDDGQILRAIREEYRVKGLWLEYYWLNRTELLFELTKTQKRYYKPFAEQSKAFLKLAQEVHAWLEQHAPRMRELMPEPLLWVFLCERYLCETKLSNGGYMGKSKLIGKGNLSDLARLHYDVLEDVDKFRIVGCETMPPLRSLEQTAAAIAKHDREFRVGHYLEYLKIQKRCFRSIERSPLKIISLDESNTLQLMGRGNDTRTPKSRKRGFT